MMQRKIIQTYGRRRSHGLSSAQQKNLAVLYEKYGIKLPENIKNPQEFFIEIRNSDNKNNNNNFAGEQQQHFEKVFAEIGFGAGEHLVQNALKNPDIAFIGCEPFENGVVNALKHIEENHLDNVKIYNGDARYLLMFIEDASIDRFYILFPDPWPKKKHNKRRLLSKEFIIEVLHKKLKQNDNSDVIIATDSEDYMRKILEIFESDDALSCFSVPGLNLAELQARPQDFIATRYEQKAISQGKNPFYLRIKKRN